MIIIQFLMITGECDRLLHISVGGKAESVGRKCKEYGNFARNRRTASERYRRAEIGYSEITQRQE